MKPKKTLNPGNAVSSKSADKGTPSQPTNGRSWREFGDFESIIDSTS